MDTLKMYNITIISRWSAEPIVIEGAMDWGIDHGTLYIHYSDGSKSIYAAGNWSEVDIEPVDNPQIGPIGL